MNQPMHPIPSAAGAAPSPPETMSPIAKSAPALAAAQGDALQWMQLSAERADEVALELRQFAAAAASMRKRLVFDSEPSDWDATFARWHGAPR